MNVSWEGNATMSGDVVVDDGSSYTKDLMETARKMHYVSSGIIAPVLVLLGIIGNALSIIVWRKKSLRSSTGAYLVAQGVNDIGVLSFFFVTDTLIMLFPEIKTRYEFGVFHAYIGYPIFYFFVVNSIWTLVGVTVDRYILVCWIDQSKVRQRHLKHLTMTHAIGFSFKYCKLKQLFRICLCFLKTMIEY